MLPQSSDENTFFYIPHSMLRAAFVGGWNTILSAGLMNLLVWATGITRGIAIIWFSWIVFCIVLGQSFAWNRLWVFKHRERMVSAHRDFVSFASVAVAAGIAGSLVLHLVVNVFGAPSGVSARLWVNVGIVCSIPFSFFTGYLGNYFLVFTKREPTEKSEGAS